MHVPGMTHSVLAPARTLVRSGDHRSRLRPVDKNFFSLPFLLLNNKLERLSQAVLFCQVFCCY